MRINVVVQCAAKEKNEGPTNLLAAITSASAMSENVADDDLDPRVVDDTRVTVTRSRTEAHRLLSLYPTEIYDTIETESDAWRRAAEEKKIMAENGDCTQLFQKFIGIHANSGQYDVRRWLYETVRDLDGIDTKDLLEYAICERGHDIEWYRTILDEIEDRE